MLTPEIRVIVWLPWIGLLASALLLSIRAPIKPSIVVLFLPIRKIEVSYSMKDGNKLSALFLFLFIMIGVLLGGVLAELLSGIMPFIARSVHVGLNPPATVDLYILDVTFGFSFKFNLGSAIGAVGAYILGKKFG